MVEQELVHAIEAVLNSKKNMKNPKKVRFHFFSSVTNIMKENVIIANDGRFVSQKKRNRVLLGKISEKMCRSYGSLESYSFLKLNFYLHANLCS